MRSVISLILFLFRGRGIYINPSPSGNWDRAKGEARRRVGGR